jgi:alpha-glucosidase
MQWTGGVNAGFSTAKPWLPVPDSAKARNVEAEQHDPKSMLSFYKTLIQLRKTPVLRDGAYVPLKEGDADILSYLRRTADDTVLVVANMSKTAHVVNFDLATQGLSAAVPKTLLSNAAGVSDGPLKSVSLEPYGIYIARLAK